MNLGLWGAISPKTILGAIKRSSVPADTTAPTVAITSTESSPSYAATIPITITFSEVVTGFVVGDITVAGCTPAGFSSADNKTFTVNMTPTANSITVDVGAGVCTDAAGNPNTAATQFAITSMFYGLVLALNMNEVSGNRADATGRGNTATQSGTVGSGTGIVGNSSTVATNQAVNFLTVAYGTDLAIGDVDWWMSVWIKTPSLAGWRSYMVQGEAGGRDWTLWLDSDVSKYKFEAGATTVTSTVTPVVDTWVNIQFGYLAATDKMFISCNGETKVEATKTGGIADNSRSLSIYKVFSGNGAANNALIDRVYRYTTAWTSALGALDYNSGSPKEVP